MVHHGVETWAWTKVASHIWRNHHQHLCRLSPVLKSCPLWTMRRALLWPNFSAPRVVKDRHMVRDFFFNCLKTLCLLFLLLQDVGYSRQLIRHAPRFSRYWASLRLPVRRVMKWDHCPWHTVCLPMSSAGVLQFLKDAAPFKMHGALLMYILLMFFVSDCLDIWTWESYLKHFLNVSLTQAYLTVLRVLQQTLLFFWKLTYVKMGSTWR